MRINLIIGAGLFLLLLGALTFIDIRKIVMFFTPNFILFKAWLMLPMICFVAIMDIFKLKNVLIVTTIKNFRKIGSIRKVGWSWGEEYYLFFHIKNFKQKIMVVIETNGSWQLIPQGQYPKERRALAEVGLANYSGTLEELTTLAEEGKMGVLVSRL